jgi:glycosyltransferase involved in cell wall biosynthesis
VLMPIPHFSRLALKLPYIKKYFRFLKLAVETRNELAQDYMMVSSKFFTLPIDVLRKRNCYFAARSCIKTLTKNAIDFSLIHAHFLENGFIGAAMKGVFGKPFVVTAHGGDVYNFPFRNSWNRTLARYVLNEADQVITVSRFNAEKLLSLGVSSSKLHVIPNGYDEKLFKPIPLFEAREKLHLPLNKKVLLSIGNLVDVKGHTYLVDAMRIVLAKRNDVILVVVGSGFLKEGLQKKARELGLNQKVLFVGSRKHDEIPIWINASDLFVLPSLSEGFPTVIPEAMACGKPVIASRVGGVPEAISSSEFGTLIAPKDPEELSQAILEGLSHDWLHEKILDEAKSYSWSNIVKQIIAVYESVTE